MNIFYLDTNPKKCAEYHCDKHDCKMIIEYGQILSTAHRFLDEDDYYIDPTTLYKKAFVNHPSTIWARTTDQNYIYLFYLWKALCREYTHRYNNIHLTQLTLEYLRENISDNEDFGMTPLDFNKLYPDRYNKDCDYWGHNRSSINRKDMIITI